MESGMAEFRIESDSLGQISVPPDDQTLKEAALEARLCRWSDLRPGRRFGQDGETLCRR